MIRDQALLLVKCAFRNGPTVWMLPGGGREEGEGEEACVAREVQEETGVSVRVERLLMDTPAEPPDGAYSRWRTYLCAAIGGEAKAGGGEGANAELVDVVWLSLTDERGWPDGVRADALLYPQLLTIRSRFRAGQSFAGSRATSWVIATVLSLLACGRLPQASTATPVLGERSCDGRAAVHADTTVHSADTLAMKLYPRNSRPPPFPPDMRAALVSGTVIVSFVVDTRGTIPAGGIWIHSETRRSFGDAVCSHLRTSRFVPLVINDRRMSVRVLHERVDFFFR